MSLNCIQCSVTPQTPVPGRGNAGDYVGRQNQQVESGKFRPPPTGDRFLASYFFRFMR
jgi:hypothetical protein